MGLDFDAGMRDWRGGPTMRPPSRIQTRAAAALIALGIGFLAGVQATGRGGEQERLGTESTEDLTRILSDLNAEADRLGQEVSGLRIRVDRSRDSATREDTLLLEARDRVADLQVLAGTVPVRGPGVAITVNDPSGRVSWDQLLDTVQELRDAGAEALALGEQRLVASSWLGPGRGGVVVDGVLVRSPYELRAVGPSEQLREALAIPGGPLSVLSAVSGVQIGVAPEKDLLLPRLRRDMRFRYARAT